MVGMITSTQPWSPLAKILLVGCSLCHLETCNHVALSLHRFWHVIFLDKDYGLEKDNDFPRVTLQLRGKSRAKTQVSRFVNLLFTQRLLCPVLWKVGRWSYLFLTTFSSHPLPSDPHWICGHWASVTVLILRILSCAEEVEVVWWAKSSIRRKEGFRSLILSSWELVMRNGL